MPAAVDTAILTEAVRLVKGRKPLRINDLALVPFLYPFRDTPSPGAYTFLSSLSYRTAFTTWNLTPGFTFCNFPKSTNADFSHK